MKDKSNTSLFGAWKAHLREHGVVEVFRKVFSLGFHWVRNVDGGQNLTGLHIDNGMAVDLVQNFGFDSTEFAQRCDCSYWAMDKLKA